MRVPAGLVIGEVAGSMKPNEVVAEHEIALNDIQAALRYAASVLATEEARATGLV